MFAVGWFVMPVQATTMTIVQGATTNETRGRVAGALNAAIQTASIASMAVAGILADVAGIRVGVRASAARSRCWPRSSPGPCSAARGTAVATARAAAATARPANRNDAGPVAGASRVLR